MTANRVLLVRHGRGRGRTDDYLEPTLAHVRESAPALGARIVVHETGAPLPTLDGVAGVVFLLADPLRERYPSCYTEAQAVAARAMERGIRVFNAPEALSNSIKSVQSRLWRAAGIRTPEYLRFESRDELCEIARRIELPAIVRSDEEHASSGLRICRTVAEIDELGTADLVLPGALTPLLDVRAGFPSRDPRARYYHKKRILVMGGVLRTKHLMFAKSPIVGSKTSVFARYRWHHDLTHRLAMFDPWLRACIRADLAHWQLGSEHEELMLRAMRVLGLDFAAIDYSDLAAGGVVLWEANPHPQIPRLEQLKMPHLRRTAERLSSYHDAIALYLRGLADIRGCGGSTARESPKPPQSLST